MTIHVKHWKNRYRTEMEEGRETEKQDLLAFAEKLGCSIYLATYLKHLEEKLDIIAEVFGNHKVKMQEPPKRKRG